MMEATKEQAVMLRELGYEGCWMEDVQEGDHVAIFRFLKDEIVMVRVKNLRRSAPQYERTTDGAWHFGDGRVLNPDDPHYVYGFVGVHDDGTETHHSFGRGYPMYRKREEADVA